MRHPDRGAGALRAAELFPSRALAVSAMAGDRPGPRHVDVRRHHGVAADPQTARRDRHAARRSPRLRRRAATAREPAGGDDPGRADGAGGDADAIVARRYHPVRPRFRMERATTRRRQCAVPRHRGAVSLAHGAWPGVGAAPPGRCRRRWRCGWPRSCWDWHWRFHWQPSPRAAARAWRLRRLGLLRIPEELHPPGCAGVRQRSDAGDRRDPRTAQRGSVRLLERSGTATLRIGSMLPPPSPVRPRCDRRCVGRGAGQARPGRIAGRSVRRDDAGRTVGVPGGSPMSLERLLRACRARAADDLANAARSMGAL